MLTQHPSPAASLNDEHHLSTAKQSQNNDVCNRTAKSGDFVERNTNMRQLLMRKSILKNREVLG